MRRAAVYSHLPLTIVLPSLLTACMTGQNYARPEMPAPAQYRFVEAPAQAETLADAPWFQVFNDPVLQKLIRDAIANNLDLRAAAARVEEARARAGIAASYLYPEVEGVGRYGLRQATRTGVDSLTGEDDTTHQSGAYGFQLSWELDLFGRIRREREAALALVM